MALFRIAESLGVPDPAELEKHLPVELLQRWERFFNQRAMEMDRMEYYLVQISKLLALVVGADQEDMLLPRGEKDSPAKKIKSNDAAALLRAAFGV